MVILAVIASLIIANQGEKASNTLGSSISSTTTTQSWRLICLVINGVEAKLYLADTPSKQAEGYMFKNSTDFLGVGAVGMLFNVSTQPGYTVAFTMRNVIFPLYLLHITPVEGVGDIVVEVIYMEPGREPYIVSARSQHDYFIELDTNFYNKYIASRGAEGILVRVAGIC
ncbi:MAG: hypothetical protein QXQ57_03040 [Sulfolobales archaeon]